MGNDDTTAPARRRVGAALATLGAVWAGGVVLSRLGHAPVSAPVVDEWLWRLVRVPDGARPAAVALCRTGDAASVAAVSLAAGGVVAVLRRREGVVALVRAAAVPASLVAAGVFTDLVAKPLIGRRIGAAMVYAYPSGHATGSAAVAAALVLAVPRRWRGAAAAAGALYAVGTGGGMWVLGSHYPTDVLAGWATGCAMAVLVTGATESVATRAGRRPRWRARHQDSTAAVSAGR